jgi:hypothetical protein
MFVVGCGLQPKLFVPLLWFTGLNGALLAAGWRLSRRLLPGAGGAERAVAAATAASALVVLGMWILSLLHAISLWGAGAMALSVYSLAWLFLRSPDRQAPGASAPDRGVPPGTARAVPSPAPWRLAQAATRIGDGGLVAAMLAAAFCWLCDGQTGGLYGPVRPFNDAPHYHLYFAAQWLQAGSLHLVPLPFGQMAAPYFPANAELVYLFWMLPFHADWLAKVGQFPYAALGALAVASLVRSVVLADARRRSSAASDPNASPPNALAALSHAPVGGRVALPWLCAGLYLANPFVCVHAVTADVDVTAAAYFLAATLFAARACRDQRPADLAYLGTALGLFLGTKYVSMIFLVPLGLLVGPAVFTVCRRHGWRPAAVSLTALWILAGPWYVRNWLVTGNPCFPADVAVGPWTLFAGAYGRDALVGSEWHIMVSRLDLLVENLRHVLPPPLLAAWLLGGLRGYWCRTAWHGRLVDLVSPAYVAVFWWVNPYNTEFRFLFPALGLACVTAARAFECKRGVGVALGWLVCGDSLLRHAPALAGRVVGSVRDVLFGPGPDALPAVMLMMPVNTTTIAVIGVAVVGWRMGRRVAAAAPGWGLGACWTLLCLMWLIRPLPVASPARWYPRVPTGPAGQMEAWLYLQSNARGATIAYAGCLHPYYLCGAELQNRVVYVNIQGAADMQWHDFWQQRPHTAAGRRGTTSSPLDSRTAESQDDERTWLANLGAHGVRWLVVFPIEYKDLPYWRDPARFPIERRWADRNPDTFTPIPLRSGNQVALYRLNISS